jgi:hypothetical protein
MTRFTPLWVQDGEYAASVDRRLLQALWPAGATNGMAVSPQPGTTIVNVAPGGAAVPTANETGTVLCVSDGVEQRELPDAGPTGTDRYDTVTVLPQAAGIGQVGGPDFIISHIVGDPGSPPVPPLVPIGQLGLANVYRQGGTVAIVPADIRDIRPGNLSIPPPAPPVPVHGFQVNRSAIQSLPHAADTVILFNSVVLDTDNTYNPGNGLYTFPAPGWWELSVSSGYTGTNAAGVRLCTMAGGPFGATNSASPAIDGFGRISFSLLGYVTGAPTVHIRLYQTSGVALQSGTTNGMQFSGKWLGP